MPRNNPEECSSQLLRGGSLKAHEIFLSILYGFLNGYIIEGHNCFSDVPRQNPKIVYNMLNTGNWIVTFEARWLLYYTAALNNGTECGFSSILLFRVNYCAAYKKGLDLNVFP
jgi:hypothetical protein